MFTADALRALLLSTLAGLATLLGALVVVFTRNKSEKLITVSLGFAAGVMLSVSFTDLYPNALASFAAGLSGKMSILAAVGFLIVGLLVAASLDRLVPHDAYDEQTGDKPHKDLYRVGFVSMLAMALHNFPEGIATFMAGYENVTLGVSIALAIALHNIPEGISVALPIYYVTGSRRKAFKMTFLSGISEPVGALLAFLVLRPFITPFALGAVFAAVAGIMIYIAVEELIPSSRQYAHDRLALLSTFTGICLMPLTHLL
ncbi:MAG: zinc transporter ZupT [Oscillospiraceae bacterium]|nr:zinc transporter ZupT [Oscillospiraceae bacterium]